VEADGALLGVRGGAARRHPVLQEEPDADLLAEQMELPDVAWTSSTGHGSVSSSSWGSPTCSSPFNFSTDDWVNFKLFGGMGLMLVFVLAQGLLLSKYIEENK
jgi:intracellular septation protein